MIYNKQTIRVLHVFARMDCGGAETMIMNIYRQIDRRRVQFDFVVHTDEKCDYDDEIISLGGRLFRIPQFSSGNIFKYIHTWKQLLSDHKEWSIVHGHVRSTASIYLRVAKQLERYTIAHSHSVSSGKGFTALVKDLLQKGIFADYYFACSEAAGRWLFRKSITKSSSYRVLPNAIDLEKYRFNSEVRIKIRNELNITDECVIGHVGRFNDVKNHSFLLDVFCQVLSLNSKAKLLLVGDGELRAKVEEKARKLNIRSSIIFAGVRTDINEVMQGMDVFVFPSKYEGLGIAVVEAQASGLPIVISDKVPLEVILTKDLVSTQKLTDSPLMWAKHVLSRVSSERKDYINEIKKEGYDICTTTKWLEEFYIEHCK